MKKVPILYRAIRKMVELVYPRIELVGLENLPEEASVLVGNHSHAHGPIISEVRLPFVHDTWCTAQMMLREEVADYAFRDFWSGKPKAIRWLYWLISRILPIPASFILSCANTIPVYRDNRCIATFRKTIDALREGRHVVIFPEHYVRYNNILWEFEDRFIDVARFYYRKTGKCLNFVPMYLAPKLRKVFFGKPIRFQPEESLAAERERIRIGLMESITQIALSLPLHTVIPYPNISPKQYFQNLPYKSFRGEQKEALE